MSAGQRLTGHQARARVLAIAGWLAEQGVLTQVEEANALLTAAGLPSLDAALPDDAQLLQHDFADGVVFVDLAPVRDPALVAGAVALALDVREASGQPLVARVQAYLRE